MGFFCWHRKQVLQIYQEQPCSSENAPFYVAAPYVTKSLIKLKTDSFWQSRVPGQGGTAAQGRRTLLALWCCPQSFYREITWLCFTRKFKVPQK